MKKRCGLARVCWEKPFRAGDFPAFWLRIDWVGNASGDPTNKKCCAQKIQFLRMASYLSRTGGQKKKKNILRQKELALRGDIRREASAEKLNRSAEKVRIAQLGVIRALRYEAEPVRGDEVDRVNDVILELDVALEYWDGISGEEIIPLYSEDLDVESTVERKRWWDFRPR